MSASPVRHPAVAGRFYPGQPDVLLRDLRTYTGLAAPSRGAGEKGESAPLEQGTVAEEKIHALGCVVPHAGYMYSGHVAGAVYARLELPKRYIILCPNHTGMGEPLSINSEGSWLTPLGEVPIDTELAAKLKEIFPALQDDALAHRSEHATEVQIPFLQALAPGFRFVPITVGVSRFDVLEALGIAMAEALANERGQVLIVASSDMNHYEADAPTRVKDRMAIDQILALDPRGLYDVVKRENISMCGFGPTVAMLTAARRLGATNAELIKYATSADTSGDYDYCVGYAGIAVS
jgi:MEMO1 family protein